MGPRGLLWVGAGAGGPRASNLPSAQICPLALVHIELPVTLPLSET